MFPININKIEIIYTPIYNIRACNIFYYFFHIQFYISMLNQRHNNTLIRNKGLIKFLMRKKTLNWRVKNSCLKYIFFIKTFFYYRFFGTSMHLDDHFGNYQIMFVVDRSVFSVL